MKLVDKCEENNKFYYKFKMISQEEFNLTNIVNKLLSVDNFIIDYSNNVIQFNIRGYYFCIDLSDVQNKFKDIYAYIDATYIDEGNVENDFGTIQLIIDDSLKDCLDKSRAIHLLEFSDDWKTCENNIKYNIRSRSRSIQIDDGEII